MKSSNKKKTLIAGALALTMACSGMFAYLTDTDQATNTFTVGKIEIELQEPNWVPPTNITPNQEIQKDPQIKNTGINDAYVFLEVTVPYAENLVVTNAQGEKQAAGTVELFSYTVKDGWEQVGSMTDDAEAKTHTYVYAYATDGTMTALKTQITTGTLFDTVKFANIVEGQGLEETTQNIEVVAKAIQVSDLTDSDVNTPEEVLAVYNAQNSAE